ncbi:hypothetical protein [Actinocrispum wychmicini]|uniref:hypothetical protein n=1 Tax=Actinocrispum wychmicini TaxID=1213861 RepID=UPI00140483E7|nr:hypothetical protein [Actinocrispum wychmicini]
MTGFRDTVVGVDAHPRGLVDTRRPGSGAAHILDCARELVQREGGYFFVACPL